MIKWEGGVGFEAAQYIFHFLFIATYRDFFSAKLKRNISDLHSSIARNKDIGSTVPIR
jgi:hypothetical protein